MPLLGWIIIGVLVVKWTVIGLMMRTWHKLNKLL